jgi:hypothetical protein
LLEHIEWSIREEYIRSFLYLHIERSYHHREASSDFLQFSFLRDKNNEWHGIYVFLCYTFLDPTEIQLMRLAEEDVNLDAIHKYIYNMKR